VNRHLASRYQGLNRSGRKPGFGVWTLIALSVAGMALAGCAESQRPVATGKGKVRGINAIVTSPELIFLNEERASGQVNYRGVSGYRDWDDLEYNFNFDVILPGETERTRIASQFLDVAADTDYTLVLTGSLANPTILSWEDPERTWDGTETVFEADFVNLADLVGQVDVYFALEGTAPVPGTEIGTLSVGDRVPYQEFGEGNYVLTLTVPGDPSTVIYESPPFTKSAGERITVALFDPDSSKTSPVGVSIIFSGGSFQAPPDIDSPPQLRILHASIGTQSVDGYLDESLSTVVFPNVGYGEISAYGGFTEPLTPLTLTAAGDSSTTLFSADIQFVANTRRTLALFGEPGSLFTLPLLDEARPLETHPVVRITHLSTNVDQIDIYEVDPGTVLDETVPAKFGSAIIGITTQFFAADAGMREFVLTLNGEKDPISVPVVLDLASGDIVDMAILDTADPAVVELLVFDSNL